MKFSTKHIILSFITLLMMGGTAMAQDSLGIQNLRSYGQNGLNEFEALKSNPVPYEGFKLRIGANFAQQWQDLMQSTDGVDPATGEKYVLNDIGPGFNLATANLNLDAQLADGIRVNVITYLSSRHHSEAYVKGGYLQIDKLPMLHSDAIDMLMHFVTLRVGHFENNYGDAHFRRTDNANAMYNSFVGNYLMDSFTTEVGAEAYVTNNGLLAMLGVTGGQLHPQVTNPDNRAPSVYGKLGYDNHANEGLRFRLTGSIYHNNYNTNLYNGDRAGARYYDIMEPDDAWSGRVEPAFTNGFTSIMINPFIKYNGLELFGIYENTNEKNTDLSVDQIAVDAVYRFGNANQLYIAGRYDTVNGNLLATKNVTVDRVQIGAGWYITKNIVLKGEYVNQEYKDYPANNFFHNAEFHGVMIEAAVGF